MTNYEAIEKVIKDMPEEWYYDLLKVMVIAAIKKKAFKDARLYFLVKKIESYYILVENKTNVRD